MHRIDKSSIGKSGQCPEIIIFRTLLNKSAKVGRIGLKDLKNPENPHFLDLDLGFEILLEDLNCFDKKSKYRILNPSL